VDVAVDVAVYVAVLVAVFVGVWVLVAVGVVVGVLVFVEVAVRVSVAVAVWVFEELTEVAVREERTIMPVALAAMVCVLAGLLVGVLMKRGVEVAVMIGCLAGKVLPGVRNCESHTGCVRMDGLMGSMKP
jgi:hypothetical protein